ncbi:MAG: hypothetical protein KGL10_01785 [Alphaproteobacteria bacterium]|nr:hypothetical protein [Alphaproteobacteria bacterium]MDE2336019.1 hypothetical protein [Alphaproteobacteria bacterium]
MDEISKVNRFVNPSLPKGDIVGKPDDRHREKGSGHKKEEPPAEESRDDTLFSLEAIRALLKQENVALNADVIAALDRLQERGVTSIPIRDEQPILDAIKDAAARL